MSDTWILVAESSRAKVYSAADRSSPLVEIQDLVHPESRLHEGDLVSDKPGSDGGSVGQGRHVLDAETTAHAHESKDFANDLAKCLERGRIEGAFGRLVLIAPPAFLGLLRDSLNKDVKALVCQEVGKNLVQESSEVLREYLR